MSERRRSVALKSERLVGQAHLPTKSSPAHARAAVSKTGVTDLGKPRSVTRGTGISGRPVMPLIKLMRLLGGFVTLSSGFPPPEDLPFEFPSPSRLGVTQCDCSDHAELPAIKYVSKFPNRA
jgi:hypothetical protein